MHVEVLAEANLTKQYEYEINTSEGVYLKEGDVVEIISDDVDVSGKFRIIGKNIEFGSNKYKLNLTINKRPPILIGFGNQMQYLLPSYVHTNSFF